MCSYYMLAHLLGICPGVSESLVSIIALPLSIQTVTVEISNTLYIATSYFKAF